MDDATLILLGTAASIGFLHTLIGIDHSLPFVVVGRSRGWSLGKLLGVTALCGLAHVASSVAIGAIGLAMGIAVDRMEWIESSRGELAAWLLIGLGLAYAVWGLYRARKGQLHSHFHVHEDGTVHSHEHAHEGQHSHVHARARENAVTAAMLFVVFLLGPCEALIPILMVPAATQSWIAVAAVVFVFGAVTIMTMLVLVSLGHFGLRWHFSAFFERHMTTLAGLAIAASGIAMQVFGI
ncbi:MAG: sulfite exporter TauE/SafE family protein [Proteobacteria bacterium]|nr:sulfite exporter TauE/SafE family protein [Pseudomonadota bacterium]